MFSAKVTSKYHFSYYIIHKMFQGLFEETGFHSIPKHSGQATLWACQCNVGSFAAHELGMWDCSHALPWVSDRMPLLAPHECCQPHHAPGASLLSYL
jgi:hypothetical protein